MKWLFNRCRRYEANLGLLAAGELPEAERPEAVAHCAECDTCRVKFAEFQDLARGLAEAGQRLPYVEAPASLRRRWMTAVRESVRERDSVPTALVSGGFSGRRVAWGSLATMWVLVLFFHVSAPDAPKAISVAVAPPSLREVLLALKVDDRKPSRRADTQVPTQREQSQPEALPPRSQRLNLSPTNREVA